MDGSEGMGAHARIFTSRLKEVLNTFPCYHYLNGMVRGV